MKQISWVNESVIYHIFPLGLCGAPKNNEGKKTAGSRILKILDWIPHIKELGCDTVLFGPIFQSLSHGYDMNLGERDAFCRGFSLAVRLMVEAMTSEKT